jgi:uncharacterized protein YndB with AHSA1/START domain
MHHTAPHDTGIHIDLEADVVTVWEALTTDAGFAAWMGAGATIDAEPGGDLIAPDPVGGAERLGRVESVDNHRELRYRWWPADDPDAASSVTIELEPLDTGTRVTVVERPTAASLARAHAPLAVVVGAAWQWRSAMLTMSVRCRVAA